MYIASTIITPRVATEAFKASLYRLVINNKIPAPQKLFMGFSPCLVEITAILAPTPHPLQRFLARSIDSKKAKAMAGGLQRKILFFLRQMNVCIFKYRGLYTNPNTVHLFLAPSHVWLW